MLFYLCSCSAQVFGVTTDWTGLLRATSPFGLYSINDALKFEFREMAIIYQV